uniref:Putative secreted protein n=1 Tax=Anopheles darlingi TaxID=43151 RepID=A0A2M4D199_ANODA
MLLTRNWPALLRLRFLLLFPLFGFETHTNTRTYTISLLLLAVVKSARSNATPLAWHSQHYCQSATTRGQKKNGTTEHTERRCGPGVFAEPATKNAIFQLNAMNTGFWLLLVAAISRQSNALMRAMH